MGDEDEPTNDYRLARQVSAGLLIAVVGFMVIAGSFEGLGRPVEPIVLVSLLVAAAGLLSVDLPGLRK